MAGPQVQDPDGRHWRVRRHWSSRFRRQWRVRRPDSGGWLDTLARALDRSHEVIWVMLALVALLVGVPVFAFAALPLLLLTASTPLPLLVVAAAVVAFEFFRRPWVVEAVTAGPPRSRLLVEVVGWRASRRALDQLRREVVGRGRPSVPLESAGPATPVRPDPQTGALRTAEQDRTAPLDVSVHRRLREYAGSGQR